MLPAKEAIVKCPQDCHIFYNDRLMMHLQVMRTRKITRIDLLFSWYYHFCLWTLLSQHQDAVRCPLKSWHSVHACSSSEWFAHLFCGVNRASVSRYMLCTFLRKAKGLLGRTDSTELGMWASTDTVVFTQHLHNPVGSILHFTMYVIWAVTGIFLGNGKNKAMDRQDHLGENLEPNQGNVKIMKRTANFWIWFEYFTISKISIGICLSHCPVPVKRHHNQGNLLNKAFNKGFA